MDRSHALRRSFRLSPCLALGCLAAAFGVRAEGWRPDAAALQVGRGNLTEAVSAALQWDWQREWRLGPSLRLSGNWELALGRWRVERERNHGWITQLTVVPNLRLSNVHGTGWYGELGIGASLLTPAYRSRDRRFSTRLNFQDHLSVGYVWGMRGEHDLSLRVDHYSNAGVREPNPGIEIYSLRYTHGFD